MASIEATRILVKGNRARGADASVLYGLDESSRSYVVKLIEQGMTLEEALKKMTDRVAIPQQIPQENRKRAEPFGPS